MENNKDQPTYIEISFDDLIAFIVNSTEIHGDIRWCDCEDAEMQVIHAADAIVTIIMDSIVKAFLTLDLRKTILMEYISHSGLGNYCNLEKIAKKLEISDNKKFH